MTIVPSDAFAQYPDPVDLGAAGDFAVLGGSTVTSTGFTVINGDLGLSPGSAITGFPPGIVIGDIHINTPPAVNGQADLTTAYNDAAGRTTDRILVAGNIGGETLVPGLYHSTSTLAISSGNLTLDAGGDANAVWIFQMASSFTMTSGLQVILSGGAQASNVFWQVGTSATIGTTASMVGTIMADQSITLQTGASLNGRALARIAAVTLDANRVTIPTDAPIEDVTLTLPDEEANEGEPVEIPVSTDDIDGKGVFAYEFTVTFDPDIVTLDDVETSGTLSEDAVVTVTVSDGSITVQATSATAISGSGDLILLTGSAGEAGSSDLTFTDVTFNAGAPNGIGIDGSIEVTAIEQVTLTLPDTEAETGISVEIPVTTNDINAKGVFSYEFTVTFDPDVVTLDDVETNGTLSEDATVTVTASDGSITVSATSATAISGSGVLILLAGTAGDVGTSDLTFADIEFNAGAPTGIGIDGSIEVTAVEEEVTLSLPNTEAETGFFVEIPVTTNDINGKGVFTYEFTVTFDPDVVTLDDVKTSGTLSEDATVTVTASDGSITVNATSATAISGNGVLILLAGTAEDVGTSDLTFADIEFNAGAPVGIGNDGRIIVRAAPIRDVTLRLPDTEAGAGSPVGISVSTTDIDGMGVFSYEFTVTFDPNVVTLNDVETNGTLSEDANVMVSASPGSITVSATSATAISGHGVLIFLTGTAGDEGISDLTFTDVTFNAGSPNGTGFDGSIEVSAEPIPFEDVTLTLLRTIAEINVPVEIPVTTNDIAGKEVLSYRFTVSFDPDIVTLDGVETNATLSEDATVTVTASEGSITVSATSPTPFTGNGVLVLLTGMSGNAGTSALSFSNITFNHGTPSGVGIDGSIEVTPEDEEVTLSLPDIRADADVAIAIPVSTNDIVGKDVFSYEFTVTFDPDVVTLDDVRTVGTRSENASVSVTASSGSITVNATSATAFASNGILVLLTGTSGDAGTSALTFTNVTFNAGEPGGLGIDGSIEIREAPIVVENVTLRLPNTVAVANSSVEIPVSTNDIDGKEVFSYEFTVTFDPSVVTFTGVDTDGTLSEGVTVLAIHSNGSINVIATSATAFSGSGVLVRLTGTAGDAGVSDLSFTDVMFNNGSPNGIGIDGSIQILPATAVSFAAVLAGINEVPPIVTPGHGHVNVVLSGRTITVTGEFDALLASVATNIRGGAHIHAASVGENGPIVIELNPTLDADERGGVFLAANNTFNVDALTYPSGYDADIVLNAIRNGDAYVNVHTPAHGGGEIRGQILSTNNHAPSGSGITSPANGTTLMIAGHPDDILTNITATESTDADGNKVIYFLQASAVPTFAVGATTMLPMDEPINEDVTVREGADLFDAITDRDPGDIWVGGTITLYLRMLTTDGSLSTAGPTTEVSLTRGAITSTDPSDELPAEFALLGNYPNPFNPSTTIRFDLPSSAQVGVQVFDMLGRRVAVVPATSMPAGKNVSVEIDAGSLSSGTYVYRITAETASETLIKSATMTLLK